MLNRRVCVIGAGVSGLACARQLAAAGALRVLVLDKGRRPGGRISSRRGVYDHGAQYFTARSPEFCEAVAAWEAAGTVARWAPAGGVAALEWGAAERAERAAGGTERWVGVPCMAQLAQAMTDELLALPGSPVEVRQSAHVTEIRRAAPARWEVLTRDGAAGRDFDAVVVAMPPPQAAPLLAGPAPALSRRAAEVSMGGSWALMLRFERRLDLPFDAAFVNAPGGARRGQAPGSLAGAGDDSSVPFTWICRNSSKPGRGSEGDTWVLHSSPAFLDAHVESEREDVARLLLAEFDRGVRAPLGAHLEAPAEATAHRWKYSFPRNTLEEPFLWDAAAGTGACGDWLGGARVEGAFMSGTRLGQAVAASMSKL